MCICRIKPEPDSVPAPAPVITRLNMPKAKKIAPSPAGGSTPYQSLQPPPPLPAPAGSAESSSSRGRQRTRVYTQRACQNCQIKKTKVRSRDAPRPILMLTHLIKHSARASQPLATGVPPRTSNVCSTGPLTSVAEKHRRGRKRRTAECGTV